MTSGLFLSKIYKISGNAAWVITLKKFEEFQRKNK